MSGAGFSRSISTSAAAYIGSPKEGNLNVCAAGHSAMLSNDGKGKKIKKKIKNASSQVPYLRADL